MPSASQLAFAGFSGDDGADPPGFQPAQTGGEVPRARYSCWKNRKTTIRSCPAQPAWRQWSRSHFPDDEESLQIVLASLRDLVAVDAHVIDDNFLACAERREIKAHGGHVFAQVLFRLLERHEYARFVELGGPPDQELHREQTVLPQPALPHKSVGRPWGRPPCRIWSRPMIPTLIERFQPYNLAVELRAARSTSFAPDGRVASTRHGPEGASLHRPARCDLAFRAGGNRAA